MTIPEQELRAAAERATQGEWEVLCQPEISPFFRGLICLTKVGWDETVGVIVHGEVADPAQWKDNAAYIVAAQPATILALLDRLQAMEAALEVIAMHSYLDENASDAEAAQHWSTQAMLQREAARAALEPKP